MPRKKSDEPKRPIRRSPGLSLHVEPGDTRARNVDAEQFFSLAERWLKSLKAFAADNGQRVTWEIVELKKASAYVQVRPVEPQTRKPIPTLMRRWDSGIRQLQKTGLPPQGFTANALEAFQEFVRAVPSDSKVTIGVGTGKLKPLQINAETQRRVEDAVASVSLMIPLEYSVRGKLRGRLAILNSWNPEERSFRLQLPLAQGKPVVCKYSNEGLVSELGSGFEGVTEVEGILHYRREEVWPYAADIDAIRVLSHEHVGSLSDLVGLLRLPEGTDSVSYVRSVRDAD
jgi:hypothetical protein